MFTCIWGAFGIEFACGNGSKHCVADNIQTCGSWIILGGHFVRHSGRTHFRKAFSQKSTLYVAIQLNITECVGCNLCFSPLCMYIYIYIYIYIKRKLVVAHACTSEYWQCSCMPITYTYFTEYEICIHFPGPLGFLIWMGISLGERLMSCNCHISGNQ